MKARQWVLKKQFSGTPKSSDVSIQEVSLPSLKDGEVMIECLAISVDPYQRLFVKNAKPGDVIYAEQVSKVIETKNSEFPVGTHVTAFAGWSTHAVLPGDKLVKVPEFPEDVPVGLALGLLGMPGLTAYYGLLKVCEVKEGQTVYVNAAAGAVGTVVGQLAKIKGCTVIGSAGTDEKVEYLKSELGFDEAFNYKSIPDMPAFDKKLKQLAPKGIDAFFENVGGLAFLPVLDNMNVGGKVAMCGNIASYNEADKYKPTIPSFSAAATMKGLSIIGFTGWGYWAEDKNNDGLKEMIQWVREGKLKYPGHNFEGFENCFKAFLSLFTGDNIGKVLVTM